MLFRDVVNPQGKLTLYDKHEFSPIESNSIIAWDVIYSCFHRIWPFSWWRHQMETFSALLAFCAGNSPVSGEFPSQKLVTRDFMFSLICVWINDWVNNSEAGDLRRHRAHYDVIVMCCRSQSVATVHFNKSQILHRWIFFCEKCWVWEVNRAEIVIGMVE